MCVVGLIKAIAEQLKVVSLASQYKQCPGQKAYEHSYTDYMPVSMLEDVCLAIVL